MQSQFFVEAHFYDNGFHSEAMGRKARPSNLPTVEKTGPRSSEIEFSPGDFAYEISRWHEAGVSIYWLGCFAHAPDRTHGDRGNYCGVGIWFLGCVPVHVSRFLDVLRVMTENISKDGRPGRHHHDHAEQLLNKLPSLDWTIDASKVVHAAGAEPLRASAGSQYLEVGPEQQGTNAFISASMLSFLFQKNSGSNRQLYLVRRHSNVGSPFAKLGSGGALGEPYEDAFYSYIAASSEAVNGINQERTKHQSALRQAEQGAARYQARVEALELEIGRLQTESQAVSHELNSIKAALQTLNPLLPGLKDIVSKIQSARLPVQSTLPHSPRSLRNSPEPGMPQPAPRPLPSSPEPGMPKPKPRARIEIEDSEDNTVRYVAWGLIVVALLALVVGGWIYWDTHRQSTSAGTKATQQIGASDLSGAHHSNSDQESSGQAGDP